MDGYITGIVDVAHWDADDHHDLLADFKIAMSDPTDPVVAVIAKATQGKDGVDSQWTRWSDVCRSAGVLMGAYHFVSQSEPGELQAEWFLAHVRGAGWDPKAITLAIDYETNPNPGGTADVEHVRAFVQRIHDDVGRWPLLYSNQSRVQHIVTDPGDVLVRCPLWLAVYGGGTMPIGPAIPVGYKLAGKSWALWQYTDGYYCARGLRKDTPKFPRCDRNVWRGSVDELRACWPLAG
jgi:lysozyme